MRTVTVNDSRTGDRYYILDTETYGGVVSTFDRSLLTDVYPLPADGGVRDDAHWQEEKHKRDKGGKFVGHGGSASGGKKGVNEVHFESKGIGGDHKLVPKNAKSKSLPHGMTVNQYIAEKHGGDVGKGLSYLKHYHGKGEFEFAAPDKAKPVAEPEVQAKAEPGTPLTKGKNAQHYNSLGVTMEHELHAKASMKSVPKGMTVKQYIDQKHGGDEGKALSWLKHHEKNGDLVIKAPGGKTQVGQKSEAELVGDSTSPVTKAQVEQAQAQPPKLTGPEKDKALNAAKSKATVEEKLQALKDAKDAKTYAKFGLTPDHVVAVGHVSGLNKYNHGQALKDNPHAKQDLAGTLKHLTQQQSYGTIKLLAPGTKVPSKPVSPADFVKIHGGKVVQSLKPDANAGKHGKTVKEILGDNPYQHQVSSLVLASQSGSVKIHDPGSTVPGLEESHAPHVATLSAAEQRVAKNKQASSGGKAEQEKSFGQASYTPSSASYHELVGQHLKPTGAHHSAMKAYSGSAFSDINRKLRKGQRDQLSSDQKKTVKDLEDFTNKSRLNGDVTLYRGMSAEGRDILHRLRPGDDFASGQFNSVSTNKQVAHSFAGGHGHVMVIRAKKGARGGFMGAASKFQHEHEVVLPHDAKLRYAGRSKEGHWVFDHVE